MSILEVFNNTFSHNSAEEIGIRLAHVNPYIYIGLDNSDIILVTIAAEPMKDTFSHRTKKLLLQCTASVEFLCDNLHRQETVHVIRCYNAISKEKDVFLKLCDALFGMERAPVSERYIMEVFSVLSSFFTPPKTYTSSELQGLYTELYTIWYYRSKFPLWIYWQSKEKMKFDFSFTNKLKLEIKSTLKQDRRHHFRHEQLTTEINDIFVLSYLLQPDDAGKSLYELMLDCIQLMSNEPDKIVNLEKVMFDIPRDQLEAIKFHLDYVTQNMRFFDAKDIPRFSEGTPDGVSNVEYDCDLNNIRTLNEDDVFAAIAHAIREEERSSV